MNNTIYQIPGLHKIAFKRKLGLDLLFFILAIALPTSFFNFLPNEIFIDIRLLYLLIGLIYITFNFKNYKKLLKIKGIKLLLIVIIFLIFRFVHSIVINDIPLIEVLTIFRTNFSYPIIIFGFLLYAVNMDNMRLYRFFYWLFIVTLISGIVYVISNLSGINFYANVYKDYRVFNNTVIMQNMASIPKYSKFLFVFSLFASIALIGYKKYYYVFIPFIVTIISIVRSELIVYLLSIFFILFFIRITRFKLRISKIVKFSIIGIVSLSITLLIFSSHFYRLIDKFQLNETMEINSENYLEEGTYKVRLDLIEDAKKEIKNDPILGTGYRREVRKGEYSYVVGGDTLIAPILYTEGYLGLIIRILPILFFIKFGIKNLRSKSKFSAFMAVVILTVIGGELLNLVQTRLFAFYNEFLMILYMLMMINQNYYESQFSTNEVS